jgi:hypothetical protein
MSNSEKSHGRQEKERDGVKDDDVRLPAELYFLLRDAGVGGRSAKWTYAEFVADAIRDYLPSLTAR